jgi:ketosteroid isomerase-like protein
MKRMIVVAVLAITAASFLAPGQMKDKKTSQNSIAEQELRERLREWDQAYLRRDTEGLSRILADDFVFTHASGAVMNKSRYIMACIKAPDIALEAPSRSDDVKVRVYGETAVVTSRATQRGQSLNSNSTAQYRYTDVWVKQQGRWRSVASQATRILHP